MNLPEIRNRQVCSHKLLASQDEVCRLQVNAHERERTPPLYTRAPTQIWLSDIVLSGFHFKCCVSKGLKGDSVDRPV